MIWQLLALLGGFGAFITALWLAGKNGSKAAQLEALKAEIKKQAEEQARAQRIIDNVNSLSADDARKRLHDVANKQR